MFKFREIGRNNTEPFTDVDVIIEEDNDRRNEETKKKFDPDKRVNWD